MSRLPLLTRCLAVLLGHLLASFSAFAHTSSTGLAQVEVRDDEVRYRLTLMTAEIGDSGTPVQRAAAGDAGAAQQVGAQLRAHLTLTVGGHPCRIKRTRLQASQHSAEQVAVLLDWQCPLAPGVLVLRDTLSIPFGEHYQSIASISRQPSPADAVQPGRARTRQEHILDREHPEARIDFGLAPPSGLAGFLRLGMEHILSGLDHLLFLAALLLCSRSLRALLITVTAFTAAHSMSLAAATLGWAQVSGTWVEPAIAVSIIWVAMENLFAPGAPLRRHLLTFAFGLVHGLAFAEALTELQLSGWPLARALLGFNLGVELGQALAVLSVAPALALVAHHAAGPRIARGLSISIAGMGIVWLAQRVVWT
jgi:hydrogenase/urease accessory protein HupE